MWSKAAYLFRNESGMTLIEIMVVSSIGLILALAMATIFVDMDKRQRNVTAKANITQLQLTIQSAASDPSTIFYSATQSK